MFWMIFIRYGILYSLNFAKPSRHPCEHLIRETYLVRMIFGSNERNVSCLHSLRSMCQICGHVIFICTYTVIGGNHKNVR